MKVLGLNFYNLPWDGTRGAYHKIEDEILLRKLWLEDNIKHYRNFLNKGNTTALKKADYKKKVKSYKIKLKKRQNEYYSIKDEYPHLFL